MNFKAVKSDLKPVPVGVVQGLILGPLTFYYCKVNDLPTNSDMLIVYHMQMTLNLC